MAVATRKPARKFRVGDWASFQYGPRRVLVEVIEDRGQLGVGGLRLYRVGWDREATEMMFSEVSDDEMSPAPSKPALLDYLKNGGLVKILKLNIPEKRNKSPIWLTLRADGRIAPTFNDSGHDLGGQVVPFNALTDGKIQARKKHPVMVFLTSLGLTSSQAYEVVRAVGTAP
jgi:hypothetical protein